MKAIMLGVQLATALVAFVLVLALAIASGHEADADFGFHHYSVGREVASGTNVYTGSNQVRDDVSITYIPSTGCSGPYAGDPVYQSQWVVNGSNWLEEGTGHQCNDTFRYWYWGFGFNGVWHSVGWTPMGTPPSTHRFYQYRGANCLWSTNIDYTQFDNSLSWCITGTLVQTGTESYSVSAVVPIHQNNQLMVSVNFAPYSAWSGRDWQNVETSYGMCGGWINDYTRSTGENSC